jgi:cyclic-di-GMP-binding protein
VDFRRRRRRRAAGAAFSQAALTPAPADTRARRPRYLETLMASDHSFDIVSEVDLNEMHNAIMQAQREIGQRFDFRGTSAGVGELDKKEKSVTLTADNEPHLEAVLAVLTSKMIKRGIDARALDRQKTEAATHKTVRQVIKLKNGIDRETAKSLQKQISDLGLKVRAQIQGDALRIVGPKLDALQAVQAAIRATPPKIPVQFNNYK